MIPIYLNHQGKRVYHYIDPKLSVSQFKQDVGKLLSVDEKSMKAIFAGKMITDDFDLMSLSKECCINIMGPKVKDEKDEGVTKDSNKVDDGYLSYVLLQIKYNKAVHGIKNIITCHSHMCTRMDNFVVCKIDNDCNVSIQFSLEMRTNNSVLNRKKNKKAKKRYSFDVKNIGVSYYKFKYYDIEVSIRVYRAAIIAREQNQIITDIVRKNKVILTDELIQSIGGYMKWKPMIQEVERYLVSTIETGKPIPNYKLTEIYRIYSNYLKCGITGAKYIKIIKCSDNITKMSKYINYLDNDGMLIEAFTPIHALITMSDLFMKNIPFVVIKNEELENVKKDVVRKICYTCCKDKDTFIGSNFTYCNECFEDAIVEELAKNDNLIVDIEYVSHYVSNRKLNSICDKLLEVYINGEFYNDIFVKCPNERCSVIYEYTSSSYIGHCPSKDIIGRKIDPSNIRNNIDYTSNRILCRECNTEFCKNCNSDPYHTGFTCDQYKEYLESDKCKYCLSVLDKSDTICKDSECIEHNKLCPEQNTSCGHPNYGFDKYELCLECCEIGDLTSDLRNEECYICMTEELHRKPCIKLDCGHIYHLDCMEQRFANKYGTNHIHLNYTYCPTCYFRISHPYINGKYAEELRDINIKIEKKSYQHMKDHKDDDDGDDDDKDNKAKDLTVTEYVNKLRYYECIECNKIYLGGLADCQDDAYAEAAEEPGTKGLEKRCLSCGAYGKKKCNKHGDKNILYKCCYCCHVGVWYCHGTTHYCEPCHGGYGGCLKVKECIGKKDCPLYGEHPTNDGRTQFAIGCSMCLSDELKARLNWKFCKSRY